MTTLRKGSWLMCPWLASWEGEEDGGGEGGGRVGGGEERWGGGVGRGGEGGKWGLGRGGTEGGNHQQLNREKQCLLGLSEWWQ